MRFSRLRTGNLLISAFFRDMRIVRPLDAEPPACFNGSLPGAKVMLLFGITKSYTHKLTVLSPYRLFAPVTCKSVFVIGNA